MRWNGELSVLDLEVSEWAHGFKHIIICSVQWGMRREFREFQIQTESGVFYCLRKQENWNVSNEHEDSLKMSPLAWLEEN